MPAMLTSNSTRPPTTPRFVATATIRDVAGNSARPVSDSARLQPAHRAKPARRRSPKTPTMHGFISKAELDGDIGVSVALPATAVAGDTLRLTPTATANPTSPKCWAQTISSKAASHSRGLNRRRQHPHRRRLGDRCGRQQRRERQRFGHRRHHRAERAGS